jgi:tryptophan 2,3-dioxygenase
MEKIVDSGKAYGFFRCDASKEEINDTLPRIRDGVGTSSGLELDLIKGVENLKGDEKITALAYHAKRAGLNYVLQATHHEGTNLDAADELAPILNQAYQSHLYETGAQFSGKIVYEENDKYVFR